MTADAEVVYFIGINSIASSVLRSCRGYRFLPDCFAQASSTYRGDLWDDGPTTYITLYFMARGVPLLLHAHAGNPHSFPARRVEIYVKEDAYYDLSYPA